MKFLSLVLGCLIMKLNMSFRLPLLDLYMPQRRICSKRGSWRVRKNSIKRNFATSNTVATFLPDDGYQQPSTKENAYEVAKSLYPHLPSIILVNPYLDQNVGSVARVMLNHGLSDLRIVNPRCDILSPHCESLAAGAFDLVRNAKVYSKVEESLEDLTTVYATSDRVRGISQIVITPEEAANQCIQKLRESATIEGQSRREKVGIMFGRETHGLYNEELRLANKLIKIPTFNHFSSLNLAQAVNLIGYEIFKRQNHVDQIYPPSEWLEIQDGGQIASRKDVDAFVNRLLPILDAKGLVVNRVSKEQYFGKIKALFYRVSELRH